jgi:hypothetical protein
MITDKVIFRFIPVMIFLLVILYECLYMYTHIGCENANYFQKKE